MNWFERYGIVGAYFLIITLAWYKIGYDIVIDESVIFLCTFSFVPIGYILSTISQLFYYKVPFSRKIHIEILQAYQDDKNISLSYKDLDEEKMEATITTLQRLKRFPYYGISTEQMRFLASWCTKRFDVISINNSIILGTGLSFIIGLLYSRFPSGIDASWYFFCWSSLFETHFLSLILIIVGVLLSLLLSFLNRILEDQIIEVNKVILSINPKTREGGDKMRKVLILAGTFLSVGLIIVVAAGMSLLNDSNTLLPVLFCLGCSAIGLAAGIINDRDTEEKEMSKSPNKYLFRIMYFIFVTIVIALLASTLYFWVKNNNMLSLTLAGFIGITGGFMGYRIRDVLLVWLERER